MPAPLALEVWPRVKNERVTDEVSLETLMWRYLGGDIEAFDELYVRTAPKVFGFLASMSDRTRAEDLCQLTFLKFHRARSSWIPGSPVMPWLFGIARNTFRDQLRSQKRARVRLTGSGTVPDVEDARSPEYLALEQETAAAGLGTAMEEAMETLSPLQREALALTKQSGLSVKDAALVLGTTESAIKLRVHRAYEALRASLRKRGRDV